MFSTENNIFFALFASFLITYIAIPKVIFFARRFRLADKAGSRSSHKGSVPVLGGLAIFSGIIFSLL